MKRVAVVAIQVLCGIIAVVGAAYTFFDHVTVKPSQKNVKVIPFSDSEDFGIRCSKPGTIDRTDSRIRFHYIVGSSREFPYVGISLFRDSLHWNLRRFDRVAVQVEPELTDNFTIQLLTFVDGFTTQSNGISYRMFEKNVDAVSSATITVPLRSLETPLWWFSQNGVAPNSNRASLRQVANIQFQSYPLAPRGKELRFHFRSITFSHSPLMALPFLLLGGFALVFPKLFHRRRSISFVPLEITDRANDDLSLLEEFLGREYARLDMSLQKVVLETGLSETTIRDLLKKFHQKGFKEYLNSIRMNEGARLLRETDRQIAEIALFTGFRHATTFTKLFGEQFGVSPREYRERSKR